MKGKQRTLKIELFKAEKSWLNFKNSPVTLVPCSKFRTQELSYSPRSKFLIFFYEFIKKIQNSKKNTETMIFNQRI